MLVDYALKRSTGLPLEISFIMYWTKRSQIKLNDKLIEYLSTITIANSDKNTFLNGLNPSFDNLEDSYQYLTAVQKKCDYRITSNISGFKTNKKYKIKPITPLDFVTKTLGKNKELIIRN